MREITELTRGRAAEVREFRRHDAIIRKEGCPTTRHPRVRRGVKIAGNEGSGSPSTNRRAVPCVVSWQAARHDRLFIRCSLRNNSRQPTKRQPTEERCRLARESLVKRQRRVGGGGARFAEHSARICIGDGNR